MPKKLQVHPNERIDIPDFVRAANDFTAETQAFNVERGLLARRAHFLEGFRVEIPDQTANPGQITVYNGSAYDRDGQLLNNEDQENTAKTITLTGASTTFYVELEFTETQSDTDARAFWDPTFDQTTPIPDGQEFSINVATRISPDWQVVNPVSTTGFTVDSTPGTLRVPLIALSTNASNEVTAAVNPGLVSVQPSTVVEFGVAAAVGTVQVLDAKLFVTGDTITVGFGGAAPDAALTITGIDYAANQISFAPNTSNPHDSGAIVRRTSGIAQFVRQRTTGEVDLTAHPDATSRMFQGDEDRGVALFTSKETFGSRDDTQIRNLKDQIDFLAAQLRELKFGAPRPDVTSLAPPVAFNVTPRHFDFAGGVQGARLPTVSVGNGTTSFGDFNGTDETAFAAAVAFLAAQGGGVLHLKAGTYTFASTVTINDAITIVGGGKEVTEIVSDVAAAPALALDLGGIDDNSKVIIEDLTVSVGTGDDNAITLETVAMVANQCDFECGIDLIGGAGVQSRILAYGCLFQPPAAALGCITGLAASSFDEELANSTFIQCTFFEGGGTVPAFACALNNVACYQCAFTGGSIANSITGTRAWSDVTLNNCQGLLGEFLVSAGGTVDRMTVQNCSWTISAAGPGAASMVLHADDVTNIVWDNTLITATFSGTGVGTQGRIFNLQADIESFSLRNSRLIVNSGQVVDMVGLEAPGSNTLANVQIENNYFETFHRGVHIPGASTVIGRAINIVGNRFNGNVQDFVQHGVLVSAGIIDANVIGNEFDNIEGTLGSLKRGVTVATTGVSSFAGEISRNNFNVGSTTNRAGNLSAAIFVEAGASTNSHTVRIVGNVISQVRGLSNIYGIYVDGGAPTVFNRLVIAGNLYTSTLDTTGAAGTVALAVNVENVNNGVITGNTVVEGVTSATDADTAVIRVNDSSNVTVVDNDVSTPVNTGTPSNFEAGILLSGGLTNVTVRGNMVQERASSDCIAGIEMLGDGNVVNVAIDDNIILMGATMTWGIFRPAAATGQATGVSCCGNRVTGLAIAAEAAGVFLSFAGTTTARGIQVNSNSVVESTWDDEHAGIRVLGAGANPMEAVQVVGNMVRGDLDGAGTRSGLTGVGIQVTDVEVYQINSNLSDWNDAAIEGNSIEAEDADHGSIIGNVCRPSQSTFAEILHSGTSTGAIIGGNIVGSAGQGGGSIADTGVDVLRGADDTATEFTNKVT